MNYEVKNTRFFFSKSPMVGKLQFQVFKMKTHEQQQNTEGRNLEKLLLKGN